MLLSLSLTSFTGPTVEDIAHQTCLEAASDIMAGGEFTTVDNYITDYLYIYNDCMGNDER